jgi:hypothetical protein
VIYYIFYYSHLSNTITYQSIGSSIHTKIDTNIGGLRDSSEYINSSHIFIYYQDFDNDGYSGYYSDDAKILAIFDTKESIGDFVQFTSPSDNRSIGFNDNGPFFRGIGPNKIYFLSIMGTSSTHYSIYSIDDNDVGTYSLTNIPIGNINYEPMTDKLFLSSSLGEDSSTFFINHDDFQITQLLTFSTIDSDISRGSVLCIESNGGIYYSNLSTGNTLEYLGSMSLAASIDVGPYVYNPTVTDQYNIESGNLILMSDNDLRMVIIGEETTSGIFTFSTINEGIEKADFFIGDDFAVVIEEVSNFSSVPYTHTQLEINGPLSIDQEYPMDGVILSGEDSDGYFGTGSSYFTNMYPGMFIMSAESIDVSKFRIFGGVGADGSGSTEKWDYVTTYNGNTYSIFTKRTYDTSDPSINHIIIIDGDLPDSTHTISLDTDEDSDVVYNIQDASRINYILLAKASGVQLTNTEIENVVNSYLSLIDETDIETFRSNINTDYATITSNFTPYYFSDQGGEGGISDGGNDMFDSGNYMSAVPSYNVPPYGSRITSYDLSGNILDQIESDSDSVFKEDSYHNIVWGYINGYLWTVRSGGEILVTSIDIDVEEYKYNNYIWWND